MDVLPNVPRDFVEGTGIAASIAQLCTSQFADFCSVYRRSRGPLPVAAAARDADLLGVAARAPRDDGFADNVRAAGIKTVIEQSLTIGERVLGTLVVGIGPSKHLSSAHRRALAHYASILSIAIDQEEQLAIHLHVSKRLQQALLPSRLATVEGAAFDAAYLPATAGTDVGGDWYDTFEVGDGLIGISVGDVVGHGLEAAVAMSEIRGAIRATAATTHWPSAILRIVDDLVTSQGIGMATAVVGIYDPTTGVLSYASCGHPSPALLWPSGRAGFLPAGGLMLGIGLGSCSNDVTVTIPRGGTLFLYTDGLLEYERDVVTGEEKLLSALENLTDDGTYALALHARLFHAGIENADDCATLALHRPFATHRKSERLVYSAIAPCASLAREALRTFSEPFLAEGDRCFELLSAVGEAVANAIEHGSKGGHVIFEIDARAEDGELVVEVSNRGHWRSFTPSIDRGRGLHIMRSYAKKLEISSAQDETRVKLTFA